ncbi:A/G-specific adenine glycosylase [Brevibacillus daliensis]|uniref:A/G-specific adenine glycosylase n=1 Tax=Brevibacillus daliensis TaxID=2892995 RepID=UPI001E3F49BA|nr:A/G-specific adenine glycosylase [Brevibacillus daliensis]
MNRKKQALPYTLPDEFQAFNFATELLHWYDTQKRDLPWRINRDAYRVWVSEIMLQQTRVETVKPYYQNFMRKFPTVEALADAPEEEVLKAWEGLGYYSRARNLQTAAKEVKETYGGTVPNTPEEISKLKGVGPYTAGAILSIAYEVPVPAVDGNVMRVFSRLLLMDDDIAKPATRKKLEHLVQQVIPVGRAGDFNQAIMELGALICLPKNPQCLTCPVFDFCLARQEGVQNTLPVKGKAKPPRPVSLLAAVVKKGDQVLIRKRPAQGLLAGLWEFPMLEDLSNEDDEEQLITALEKEYEIATTANSYLMNVQHTFSHLHWDVEVYVLQYEDGELFSEDARFVSHEEIRKYAFPVLHNKIIDQIYPVKDNV